MLLCHLQRKRAAAVVNPTKDHEDYGQSMESGNTLKLGGRMNAKPKMPEKPKVPERGRQYPGVKGKVVDWIEHKFEEGRLYIHVRFQDRTEVTFTVGSRLQFVEADLSDISTGDFKPIREYIRYAE